MARGAGQGFFPLEALADLIVAGVEHEGFSFLQVLQPSVTFNDKYEEYNQRVEVLGEPASDLQAALALAREGERLPAGIIFRTEKITQERALYGDRNPVRDRLGRAKRIEKVRELLSAA